MVWKSLKLKERPCGITSSCYQRAVPFFRFLCPKLLKFRKNYCFGVEINNIICYNYKDIIFKRNPLCAVKIGK